MSDAPRPAEPGAAGPFDPAARQAVYDVIGLRRDIRSFRPDPVPDEVLARILSAAHQAGSVGFMQPWDFILVRSPVRRAEVYELFRGANERAATRWRGDRRAKYGALKLQGILDAPLCVCVTCDTQRGGPHVLGRDSIPETDVYSTCLAVQNLWLAARAEGVGVGWVSIVDNRELTAALALPEGVVPVAFLCVGYPVEFPEAPMLEATGWRGRTPLSELVHLDGWGGRDGSDGLHSLLDPPAPPAAAPEPEPWRDVPALCAAVAPAHAAGSIGAAAAARLDELAKPRGSLGRVEELALRLAQVQGTAHPSAGRKHVLVFAGDHGVCAEWVSAYLPEATARLCYNFVSGGGVVNAFARQAGAKVTVVDVGVDHDFEGAPGIVDLKVARGTRNLAREPAMARQQAERAILAGARAVLRLGRCDVMALGEVGIGNTTAASALLALLLEAPAEEVVGAGTGVGSAALARKRAVVGRALQRWRGDGLDTIGMLAAVGGFEIAALAGAVLAGAARRIPVVLDGFIVGVAALVAARLSPSAAGYLVASHRSAEPGHERVLRELGLRPLLELELRLGEGSGAVLALPLVDAACALFRDVRTFREAGIAEPLDERGVG